MEVFVMVFKRLTHIGGEKEVVKPARLLGLAFLVCLFTVFGSISCQQAAEEMEGTAESGVSVKEGLIEFEGMAKVVQGKFLYVPEAQGFDIVIQGPLSTGDLTSVLGKEVRGEGAFSPEVPSLLVANILEVKDESGVWSNVFTLSEEVTLEDYLNPHARDEFQALDGLAYNKAEDWESLEKGKVQGRLVEVDGSNTIVLFDGNNRETGRIVVDEMTDFSRYYIQKLNLFDSFWFYLTIKDTVDWNTRRRTRELFHADVVFAGLF
jgi:hypothetical protein